ncbi:MAG: hypothetical protein HKL99_10450 [Burkholderiales bacterium]|nr:hypothetical protein [Burkholderiales bacterium]
MTTNDTGTVELEARSIRFYSAGDEDAFFRWLRSLPCIARYYGVGPTLRILVVPHLVDEGMLRELLAMFRRYSVDMRQLALFDKPEFADWFRNDKAYWHKAVFE